MSASALSCASPPVDAAQDSSARPNSTTDDQGEASESDASEEAGGFVRLDSDPSFLACDIWSPDCPAGQKCAPHASANSQSFDGFACVDVFGDIPHASSCKILGDTIISGLDDCESGSWCFSNDPNLLEGVCLKHCQGSQLNPYCPLGSECLLGSLGTPAACGLDCHPDDRPCPDPGILCVPTDDGGWACAHSAGAGQAPHGTPCQYANTCDAGNVCAPLPVITESPCQGSQDCCAERCTMGVLDECPNADEQCVPYYSHMPSPPGYEDIGYCSAAG